MLASQSLTALERVSPLVLESFLRNSTSTGEGDYSDEATKQFLASNCPRFENFSTLVDGTSSVTGKGLDVQMYIVHKEYCDTIENKILVYLKGMNVEVDRFRLACSTLLDERETETGGSAGGADGNGVQSSLSSSAAAAAAAAAAASTPNRSAVLNLVRFIEQYQDFLSFGRMMEVEFQRLHPRETAEAGRGISVPAQTAVQLHNNDTASTEQALSASPSQAAVPAPVLQRAVRVLWDIENIAVPRKLGGMETVHRLTSFLRAHSLCGTGIDTRITVFFNPSKANEQVVRELDSAAVELVWISNKQEDADRKLVMRISQEMAVLPAASTSFVLISSDKDFRSQLQLLSSAGYCAYVVHDAKHEDWKRSLEMHATEAFQWRQDVLQDTTTDLMADRDRDAPPPYDANGPSPSKHRREIDRAATSASGAVSGGGGSAQGGEVGPGEVFSSFLGEFGVSHNPNTATTYAAAIANKNNGNGKGNNHGRNRGDSLSSAGGAAAAEQAPSAADEVLVRFITGGTAVIKSWRLFNPKELQNQDDSELSYLKACVLRWKGPFGFLAIPIVKTAEELATEAQAANAAVSAGDIASNGASSLDSIHAVRAALGLDAATSASTHLVKIYAHHSSLQFEPHKNFLSRGDVCRVAIGPNPKGPVAMKIINV